MILERISVLLMRPRLSVAASVFFPAPYWTAPEPIRLAKTRSPILIRSQYNSAHHSLQPTCRAQECERNRSDAKPGPFHPA